jgi:HSP20 family molecular chaperone IbpA
MTQPAQFESTKLIQSSPFRGKRPERLRRVLSPRPTSTIVIRSQCLARDEKAIPVDINESTSEYKFIVPLAGIDARNAYVFAKPHSLLIEFRMKTGLEHWATGVTERIDCRILREFSLPDQIEAHSTVIRVCGDSLRITARKAEEDQQLVWSELIAFDTRSSLGCV